MINCIIVEDEVAGQQLLLRSLKSLFPSIEVLAICDSVSEAVLSIKQLQPKLVFLDVQIKGGTGFDVLEQTEEFDYEFIFLTAFDQYAIEALNKDACYYLLKPFVRNKFIEGVESALKKIKNNSLKNHILVPDRGHLVPINLMDILFLESKGAYTTIHSLNEVIISTKNIGYYESTLPSVHFIRTHHSYIVNLRQVKRINQGRGGKIILNNDVEIPISQRKMPQVISKYYI